MYPDALSSGTLSIKEKILEKESNKAVLEYLKEQKSLTDTRYNEDKEYVDDEKKTETPDVITGSTYSTKSLLDTLVKLMEEGITRK